jgi:DNA-binding transcriptional ArsR family regulator
MPDLLAVVHAEIRERRDQLRATFDEYERLTGALAALDGARDGASTPPPRRARANQATRAPRPTAAPKLPARKPRAPRGANRAAVLKAVSERPGASASELAAASGVSRPVVYNLLKSLTERGELVRRELPGGVAGYAPTPEPSAFGPSAAPAVADDAPAAGAHAPPAGDGPPAARARRAR